ncbi:MAG: hypothetical protein ACLPJY_19405 [Rhodomicrobium sp.]
MAAELPFVVEVSDVIYFLSFGPFRMRTAHHRLRLQSSMRLLPQLSAAGGGVSVNP